MRALLVVAAVAACGHAAAPGVVGAQGAPALVTFGHLGPRVGDTQVMVRDHVSERREVVDGGDPSSRTHQAHLAIAITIRALDGDVPTAATFSVRAVEVIDQGVAAPPNPTVGKTYQVEVAATADDGDDLADDAPGARLQVVSVATDAERTALPLAAIPGYVVDGLRREPVAPGEVAVMTGGAGAPRLTDVHDGVARLAGTRTTRTLGGTTTTSTTYAVEVATGRVLERVVTVTSTWAVGRGVDATHDVEGSSTRTVRERFTYR